MKETDYEIDWGQHVAETKRRAKEFYGLPENTSDDELLVWMSRELNLHRRIATKKRVPDQAIFQGRPK